MANQSIPVNLSGKIVNGTFIPKGTIINTANDANTMLLLLGEDFTDSSSNNLTVNQNSRTLTTGKYGQGYSLPNANFTVDNDPALDMSGNFTVEFWAKSNTWGDGWHPFSHSNDSDKGFYVYLNNTNSLRAFACSSSGRQFFDFTLPSTLVNGQFHHFAFTGDGSIMKCYIDGVKAHENHSYSISPYDNSLFIGTWIYGNQGTSTGVMDEIRVSNVVRYTSNFTPVSFA